MNPTALILTLLGIGGAWSHFIVYMSAAAPLNTDALIAACWVGSMLFFVVVAFAMMNGFLDEPKGTKPEQPRRHV